MIESSDFHAFRQAGLADAYLTVGDFNLFMECAIVNNDAFCALPPGRSFRLCKRDELETWKSIVVEEQYADFVTDYYNRVYSKREDDFYNRCTFVCDETDRPIASCFVWNSYGCINTLAWFRVLPEYEGKGVGRALLTQVLKDAEYPVYLHTQPTSARAIKLYSDFGFALITNPAVGYRKNDLTVSLPYLKKVMPDADYAGLRFTRANGSLLAAALMSKDSEF